ncbi:hypothetical protein MYX78_00985 [Acidobacteria bacterium AH-259-G07]|nr:hypothetical protein [Acidobacteria bacterium AH-259-G07]
MTNNVTKEIEWYSLAYDFLEIAHRALKSLDLENFEIGGKEDQEEMLTCMLFSFLCLDGVFNYLWLIEYRSREQGSGNQETLHHWNQIDTEKKWIRKKFPERIDLLALSVSGQNFFEASAPRRCRDLFQDYTDLRNALFHSVPDQTYFKKEILERDGCFTKYSIIQEETVVPRGRRRTNQLSARLSPWENLAGLGPQHALDVFKITLAVLARTNSLFWMPFFRGTFFEEKLRDFKTLYREFPPSPFDQLVEETWTV